MKLNKRRIEKILIRLGFDVKCTGEFAKYWEPTYVKVIHNYDIFKALYEAYQKKCNNDKQSVLLVANRNRQDCSSVVGFSRSFALFDNKLGVTYHSTNVVIVYEDITKNEFMSMMGPSNIVIDNRKHNTVWRYSNTPAGAPEPDMEGHF